MSAKVLAVPVPADFVLARDVCSYGYFLLEPNHWDARTNPPALTRVVTVPGPRGKDAAVELRVEQGAGGKVAAGPGNRWRGARGRPLRVTADAELDEQTEAAVVAAVRRMLRLGETAAEIAAFHRLDPRWKGVGYGRLFRSPTFFEDVVKTVTSCNVTWPGTVGMNRRLCWHLGERAAGGGRGFPTAARLARVRPATLRARCGVGYRDARIVELARMFVDGRVSPAWFEDLGNSDEAVREALLELPGVGPYAAANILQLLGRYGHLPLDTESVRHGRTVLGMRGSGKAIMKRVGEHFAPFGAERFRSYWFELWAYYEAKRGPAWTWEKHVVGTSFTASKL